MLKCFLALAVVVETKLVHSAVADCPSMGNVPLLNALRNNAAETGDIRASKFEVGKRLQCVSVVKIVIEAQILFVIDSVVYLNRELVAAYRHGGNGRDQIAAVAGIGNKLQQIHCCRVQAGKRDLVSWENRWWIPRSYGRIRCAILNQSTTNRGRRGLAAGTV